MDGCINMGFITGLNGTTTPRSAGQLIELIILMTVSKRVQVYVPEQKKRGAQCFSKTRAELSYIRV